MALNPYEVLANNSPILVKEVLDGNDHIGEFLYKVFLAITQTAGDRKADIRAIDVHAFLYDDSKLKIDVTYGGKLGEHVELGLLWKKNLQIARVLEVNPRVRFLAVEVCELLQGWAGRHNIPLKEVVVHKEIIPRGEDCIIAELLTTGQFVEFSERKVPV